jgi:N6-L-threonylcarbamoyladenine synthase
MRVRPVSLHGLLRPRLATTPRLHARSLLTLAIETSCDDTSVAVLEATTCTRTKLTAARLYFHKKITSNNKAFNGVHPLVALESHQENLAKLPRGKLGEALHRKQIDQDELGEDVLDEVEKRQTISKKRLPDLIAVTRGPGMRSNLFTGLDTAKGLAVAWQKPLVGVHHMQAHALTPRLVDALQRGRVNWSKLVDAIDDELSSRPVNANPCFPFLSVLASGGHTLLIHSASLTDHRVLASTGDIAIGECLDKLARIVLPNDVLQKAGSTMYGQLLETFAFPEPPAPKEEYKPPTIEDKWGFFTRLFIRDSANLPKFPDLVLENSTAAEYCEKYEARYTYTVPKNNEEALKRNMTSWGWGFNQPLSKAQGGLKSKSMEMSFSGLVTAVERVIKYRYDPLSRKLTKTEREPEEISIAERKDMAHHAMRAAFE